MAKKNKTQADINSEAKDYIAQLKEQALLQQEMSTSVEGYINALKKVKSINETVKNNQRIIAELEKQKGKGTKEEIALNKAKLDILEQQTAELEKQGAILARNLKEVNKGNLIMAKGMAGLIKSVGSLPGLYRKGLGELKSLGLLDMDKSMKNAALSMGILSKQTDGFRKTITEASFKTNQIGVGVEELAKIQANYSDELGRTVMLSQQGLQAMAEMAKSSGLGAEGSSRMAADMQNQGLSAERTRDFTEQTMNDAHKMGLNASKVVKNISANMKMLNKYNFKGGVKGLAKMAETTTKLGIDMNSVAGMAEKLFDIEGAVDMSAQLQVMGGAWAKLADPFKLMYMARNDMEGLTEQLGKAAEASVTFDKATGEFKISALEMHRLRKVAEQTGVAYEDLATAGKNARKYTEIKKQVGFKFDKKTEEFIANTATFAANGEAKIMIDGKPKLVKQLTQADQSALAAQINQKASMKEMAETSQNFDDQLTNLINMLKTAALPILDSLNKNLLPKMKSLFERMEKEKWFDKIGGFAKTIGDVVGKVGGLILEYPKTFAAVFAGGKIASFLFDKLSWITNGKLLAMGFNSSASVGGGGSGFGGGIMDLLGGGLRGGKKGGMGRNLLAGLTKSGKGGGMLGKLGSGLKVGGGLGIAGLGLDVGRGMMDDPDSDTGKALGVGSTAAGWAGTGAMIGSVIPGLGTAAGAIIGGIAGAGKGIYDEYFSDDAKKAKVTGGIHDGILDSDFSKGRGIVDSGKITPIDNKDNLMAYKPNGPIDNALKSDSKKSSTVKIEFGEIHFKFDELKVVSPGNPGVAIDLIKDPQFIRSITRMVHSETEKVINGGTHKG